MEIVEPEYVAVMVVKGKALLNASGTCTIMVPTWPGSVGTATVDVATVEPEYLEVTVVKDKEPSATD